MLSLVVLPCFDLCRSNSSHVLYIYSVLHTENVARGAN